MTKRLANIPSVDRKTAEELSKSDWMEAYYDLYTQWNGQEPTAGTWVSDAKYRLEITKLVNRDIKGIGR